MLEFFDYISFSVIIMSIHNKTYVCAYIFVDKYNKHDVLIPVLLLVVLPSCCLVTLLAGVSAGLRVLEVTVGETFDCVLVEGTVVTVVSDDLDCKVEELEI